MNPSVRNVLKRVRGEGYRLINPLKARYCCPVCDYTGPFMSAKDPTGERKDAICPSCSCAERHRLQWLVLEALPERAQFKSMHVLHCAPEGAVEKRLRRIFGKYSSADLLDPNVDHKVDLRNIPFEDSSFDVVFASHVLEHIPEDVLAIKEIRRILRPNGFAILPVPVVNQTTIEYDTPNPAEWGHVRAPGLDYFDRMKPFFSRVRTYVSSEFDEKYQPFLYEDRSQWPSRDFPHRQSTPGLRHDEIVPIGYAN